MDIAELKKKFSIEELRKSHPKAFTRWTEEEDKELLRIYEDFTKAESKDFEGFLQTAAVKFERKVNAIRGRLSKFFPDIPGWDYEAMEKREEARKEAAAIKAEEKAKSNTNQKVETEEEPEVKFDFTGNEESFRALQIMEETNKNLFLTGEAGTGKSTLLQYFRQSTKKSVVVLAPTGVAALNVQGQTIHSFCSFGPDITLSRVKKLAPWMPKSRLLRRVETIIIDEISMVRADLLDCVDKFLRINGPEENKPFGGIQMVFIGDLFQLPPVEKDFVSGDELIKEYESPYFFDSRAFKAARFEFIQLKQMYRQKDQDFIEILNGVRNNQASEKHLELLNQRAQAGTNRFTFEEFAVYLSTTNSRVNQVNNYFLEKLSTPLVSFQGTATGSFEDRALPTEEVLQIKVGAQVMMLNNDRQGRWVNGTMAKVLEIKKEEDVDTEAIVVELDNAEIEEVYPYTWEMLQFAYDQKIQEISSKPTGTYTQYPLKLAWAVTIHKSQGKTFNKVYVDLSTGTFAHGQLYVALSRCRTLDGLFLKRPITRGDILLDNRIVEFLQNFSES